MNSQDEKSSVLPELRDIADSFWGFFVFNRRLAIMVGLIFAVLGTVSFFQIPREAQPEVQIPFATVVTAYPGASPKEVADQVTFKLEQKIKSVENLAELTSTSSEGVSQIFVEFDPKADVEDSLRKLKDKVDEAKASLPEDATDPSVREISFSDEPIIIFSMFGDLPYEQLLEAAKEARDSLEKIAGVQSANIAGERERQVLVAVREADMVQYGLSLRGISRAIQSFHFSSPVGNVRVDDQFYQVRIEADQDTAEQIGSIPLSVRDGATIYVRDVAQIREELKEATSSSRVSRSGEPSKNAVSISLVKKTGENVIKTVDEARAAFQLLQANGSIPDSVQVIEINDTAKYIQDDFNSLMGNALGTVALIFGVLLLALGFKEALIGSISIPFTFFVTFAYLNWQGASFNFMVLFSLILGLGLLVDAAIVVMEGMHENLYRKNLSPVNAALMTIQTYRWPLISGMLTTVAAFLPMLMVSGIIGEFFKFIPITISAVLISSLLIGLLILPAYSVIFLHQARKEAKPSKILRFLHGRRERFIGWVDTHYQAFLGRLLAKRRTRFALLAVSLIAFASAAALPVMGLVKVEAFPLVDAGTMSITIEMPAGTAIEKVDPVARKIEPLLQADPNVKSYVVNLSGGGSGKASASFTVNFVDEELRELKTFELEQKYKKDLAFITEGQLTLSESRSGPPSGADIQLLVFGEDYTVLKKISSDLQAKLEQIGGDQVKDNLEDGTAEFTFDFSQPYQKALLRQQGLTAADVAQEVRMAVYPTTSITLKRGEEEVDVNLQREWGGASPSSIDQIRAIPIQNLSGSYIPLSALAEPRLGPGLSAVNHFDGEQAITVSSGLAPGKVAADVLGQLEPFLASYDWPRGYSWRMSGGDEETQKSFQDLLTSMVFGLILILLILITQFNSFKQPFVILMTLPMSLIGVFYGFMLFGIKLSIAAMIGIVALSGIVINDAIVLIDRINQNRQNGMRLAEAIQEAGPARLQPIIITSVTTVLGILPISLTDPFWLALGMAIVFGMAFSTVLTLILVPVLYYAFERRGEAKRMKGS